MGKYIDISKVTVPKDFFNNLNVPKLLGWLNSQPPADVVSMGVLEQVQWERDIAIEQLESYGVGFAEKADVARVVRCKDCVYYKEGKILAPEKFCFRLQHPTENRKVGYNFCDDDFCSKGERKADNGKKTDRQSGS